MTKVSFWRGQAPKFRAVASGRGKRKIYKCYQCDKELKGYAQLRQHLMDHKTGFIR